MEIRMASEEDAEEILKIYSYYVEETAISFEYVTPSVEEFKGRISNTLKKYPYLVAVEDGKIIGFSYAGVFKGRAAYDHCVETTLYVDRNCKGKGIGKSLYSALEEELRKIGIKNLYACIAFAEEEDEYLTNDSNRFHERMGYTLCGRFHKCGYKFNTMYDMIWMEKYI